MTPPLRRQGEPDTLRCQHDAFCALPDGHDGQHASVAHRCVGQTVGGRCIDCLKAERDLLSNANDHLSADNERLRKILDHPDPQDFVRASEIEARFQMDLWGTTEGFPTAFDGQEDHHFAYLIGYLTGKVAATKDDDLDKKLHRITTIAAAACNWHTVVNGRQPLEGERDRP